MPPKRDISTHIFPWLPGTDLRVITEMNNFESVVNMESICYCCDSAVRGYHIYQDIWEAYHGELLSCSRETGNVYGPFAVDRTH